MMGFEGSNSLEGSQTQLIYFSLKKKQKKEEEEEEEEEEGKG